MYQAKVNNTQQYSDSQGKHIVCKGKLVMLPIKDEQIYDNNIIWLDFNKWFLNPYDNPTELLEDYKPHKPIIISETEEIEVEDWVYSDNGVLTQCESLPLPRFKKVLALPEHFSDKHLQAIVDGKMKDGDEVLVKTSKKVMDEYEGVYSKERYVHLDQYNHITLFPAKQSLEEAFCKKYNLDSPDKDLDLYDLNPWKVAQWAAKWAKKNNY